MLIHEFTTVQHSNGSVSMFLRSTRACHSIELEICVRYLPWIHIACTMAFRVHGQYSALLPILLSASVFHREPNNQQYRRALCGYFIFHQKMEIFTTRSTCPTGLLKNKYINQAVLAIACEVTFIPILPVQISC